MSEDKITRAMRRHHRERIINKRKAMLSKDSDWHKEPGRLAKYNLTCSCPYCRDSKYRDRPRRKRIDWEEYGEEM